MIDQVLEDTQQQSEYALYVKAVIQRQRGTSYNTTQLHARLCNDIANNNGKSYHADRLQGSQAESRQVVEHCA